MSYQDISHKNRIRYIYILNRIYRNRIRFLLPIISSVSLLGIIYNALYKIDTTAQMFYRKFIEITL